MPTMKLAGGGVAGFIAANYVTNKIAASKGAPDSLKSGWGIVALKAVVGLVLGYAGRRFGRGQLAGLGEGLGIGALVSAGLDAWAKVATKAGGAGTAGLGDFGIDEIAYLPEGAGGELAGVMVQDPATGEWLEVVDA